MSPHHGPDICLNTVSDETFTPDRFDAFTDDSGHVMIIYSVNHTRCSAISLLLPPGQLSPVT
eukprot:1442594-Pyramimonas_sp.AAC.1